MGKNQRKYLLVLFVIVLCGMAWLYLDGGASTQWEETDMFEERTVSGTEEDSGEQKVYVHIVGAVKKPGVYIFDGKPRVIEVVEKAGGFKKDAIRTGINQAEVVEDGAQIVIESSKEKETVPASGEKTDTGELQGSSNLVNINSAAKEELMTLTGIGEAKAISIISYRETKGKFKKIEDIMNITGIKEGVFEKIKNQIRV